MKCRICEKDTRQFANAKILGRHSITYFYCNECGFLQTEDPFWLDEAYSEAIASGDIGLLGRNIFLARITTGVISFCLRSDGPFLDYGGGYGIFVRLMRDRGFDFRWDDPLCKNLFSRGFEAKDGDSFEMLTAFEVFEHLPQPAETVEKLLLRSKRIFFSTELLPSPPPKIDDWWYYALESGQHVSFYSKASLQALARRFGLHLYTNGRSLHLLTAEPISRLRFRMACSGRIASVLDFFLRRKSLLADDHRLTLSRLRGRIVPSSSQ